MLPCSDDLRSFSRLCATFSLFNKKKVTYSKLSKSLRCAVAEWLFEDPNLIVMGAFRAHQRDKLVLDPLAHAASLVI
jgi:hypothetical protein